MKSMVLKQDLWRDTRMLELEIKNESQNSKQHHFTEEEAIKEAENKKCIVAFY